MFCIHWGSDESHDKYIYRWNELNYFLLFLLVSNWKNKKWVSAVWPSDLLSELIVQLPAHEMLLVSNLLFFCVTAASSLLFFPLACLGYYFFFFSSSLRPAGAGGRLTVLPPVTACLSDSPVTAVCSGVWAAPKRETRQLSGLCWLKSHTKRCDSCYSQVFFLLFGSHPARLRLSTLKHLNVAVFSPCGAMNKRRRETKRWRKSIHSEFLLLRHVSFFCLLLSHQLYRHSEETFTTMMGKTVNES